MKVISVVDGIRRETDPCDVLGMKSETTSVMSLAAFLDLMDGRGYEVIIGRKVR